MLRPGKKFHKRPSLVAATTVLLLALLIVPSTVVLTAKAQSQATAASGDKPAGSLSYRAADAGPTSLGPIVNSSGAEWDSHISVDGLSLYFISIRPGGLGKYDIWVTKRKTNDDPWGTPINLGPPINSSAQEGAPCTSADELSLYFMSRGPGGFGGSDIWVATRRAKDDSWSTPVNLGPTVNSPLNDDQPSISTDGLSLYFSSTRSPNFGEADIWVTTRKTKEGPWGTPVNLGPTVNSSASEDDLDISADGLSLYFSSSRGPGLGGNGIWVTTRKTKEDPWGTPVNLGPTVNSPYDAYNPDISTDGSTLYFITDRPGSVRWSYDIWQVVLEKGAQASSLQSEAFVGDLARVKAFLDANVDVNQKNASGVTALYSAASGGRKEVVELLLAEGADINEKNAARTDLTALHAAARQGHKEIVEVLLASGADVDVNTGSYYYKRTAAEIAMERNHNEVVKLLIAKGADISALHFAIHMKDYTKAKSLIESGADVNKQIRKLGTPLHLAATSGQKDVAELLIAKGANMNIQAGNGRMPLHLSVSEDDRDMVELLVTKGADINAKSKRDRTPLDIAILRGYTEIIELLRKHGAKE